VRGCQRSGCRLESNLVHVLGTTISPPPGARNCTNAETSGGELMRQRRRRVFLGCQTLLWLTDRNGLKRLRVAWTRQRSLMREGLVQLPRPERADWTGMAVELMSPPRSAQI